VKDRQQNSSCKAVFAAAYGLRDHNWVGCGEGGRRVIKGMMCRWTRAEGGREDEIYSEIRRKKRWKGDQEGGLVGKRGEKVEVGLEKRSFEV